MFGKRGQKIGIYILIALFTIQDPLFSLPKVDEVVSGDAEIEYTDNTLTINATDNTIINFDSFDIMENESVIIKLPSTDSQILSRVLGVDASELFGNLSCNGLFILVNTSGIYIGASADINVGSIVLSTRDILNKDFLDRNYIFKKLSDEHLDKLLENHGKITIQNGGFGVMIAGGIENDGVITATVGRIVLACGDAIKLDISGDGMISVAIDEKTASTIYDHEGNPITDQLKNTGTIEADGGIVILKAESLADVFEKAINLNGIVRANKIENKDGRLLIVADGDIAINDDIEATHVEIDTEKGIYGSDESIIKGEDVKITGNAFGTDDTPLSIRAKEIYVKKRNDSLDIVDSILKDHLVTLKGDGETGFGAIEYNHDTDLTLDAETLKIIGDDPTHFYGDITFHNFSCDGEGKEIIFEADSHYTFKGDTYIKGGEAIEAAIRLVSSVGGRAWYSKFDDPGEVEISYVILQDAHNEGEPVKIKYSIVGGNSVNWDSENVLEYSETLEAKSKGTKGDKKEEKERKDKEEKERKEKEEKERKDKEEKKRKEKEEKERKEKEDKERKDKEEKERKEKEEKERKDKEEKERKEKEEKERKDKEEKERKDKEEKERKEKEEKGRKEKEEKERKEREDKELKEKEEKAKKEKDEKEKKEEDVINPISYLVPENGDNAAHSNKPKNNVKDDSNNGRNNKGDDDSDDDNGKGDKKDSKITDVDKNNPKKPKTKEEKPEKEVVIKIEEDVVEVDDEYGYSRPEDDDSRTSPGDNRGNNGKGDNDNKDSGDRDDKKTNKNSDEGDNIDNNNNGFTNNNNGDGSGGWERFSKRYPKGKYRTIVIVFEGKVAVGAYDEDGPKYDDGVLLLPGQKAIRDAEII